MGTKFILDDNALSFVGHLQYKNFPMKLQCKIRAGLRRVSRKGWRGGGGLVHQGAAPGRCK